MADLTINGGRSNGSYSNNTDYCSYCKYYRFNILLPQW